MAEAAAPVEVLSTDRLHCTATANVPHALLPLPQSDGSAVIPLGYVVGFYVENIWLNSFVMTLGYCASPHMAAHRRRERLLHRFLPYWSRPSHNKPCYVNN